MKLEGIKKAKSKKNIRGYKIKGTDQNFLSKKTSLFRSKKISKYSRKDSKYVG